MNPFALMIKILVIPSLIAMMSHVAMADTAKEKQDRQQFVELLPKDFKPAFTRETVIKLNAIVRRSYDAINEYDAVIEKTYTKIMQASESESNQQYGDDTRQQLSTIQKLADRSSLALSDMTSAVDVLRKSGEEHNEAILAGMIDFVQDVNREINKKNKEMHKLINKS